MNKYLSFLGYLLLLPTILFFQQQQPFVFHIVLDNLIHEPSQFIFPSFGSLFSFFVTFFIFSYLQKKDPNTENFVGYLLSVAGIVCAAVWGVAALISLGLKL